MYSVLEDNQEGDASTGLTASRRVMGRAGLPFAGALMGLPGVLRGGQYDHSGKGMPAVKRLIYTRSQ